MPKPSLELSLSGFGLLLFKTFASSRMRIPLFGPVLELEETASRAKHLVPHDIFTNQNGRVQYDSITILHRLHSVSVDFVELLKTLLRDSGTT